MTALRKRELLLPHLVKTHPSARGFYKPQRDRVKQPMPARQPKARVAA